MDIAARWPERVAGLVLAGATARSRRDPRAPAFHALAWIFETINETWLRRSTSGSSAGATRPAIAEPIIAGGFYSVAGPSPSDARRRAFRPRLAAYAGPTLLINGQLDPLFRLSQRSFAEAADDARRRSRSAGGPPAEHRPPEGFSAALRWFAARSSRPWIPRGPSSGRGRWPAILDRPIAPAFPRFNARP